VRAAQDVDADARAAFLDDRCGNDAALRCDADAALARIERHESEEAAASKRVVGESNGIDADDAACGTDALLDTSLGAFRLVERIGRGGMGVVYRGTREGADFAQDVAIKLVRRGFDFDDVHARFLRERRILARLDHPNLARFIDGGVAPDGRPWFALEYVRGTSLVRWCDEHRLSLRERVRLFLEVCSAVQHAHAQLIVHRDLKPANILVDGDGHVRLLDFGIARLLEGEDEAGTTIAGRYAFTPEYAAPEQFGGESSGVATDVYALGVILYELLSGALPYALDRHDLVAAERVVRNMPPLPLAGAIAREGDAQARMDTRATTLRSYRAQVAGDLSRILDKALAKEPARRYASVETFADDLRSWLAGAPVRVSGNGFGYRLRKFVGRNRVAAALAALTLLAVGGGVAATVWQMREAQVQRDDALAAARRSDAVRTYLMLMFRDAAGQKDATKVNVREVFKSGTARLFDEFRDDPAAGQTTALMLSDLYLQLGDVEGARPLLERLLQWPGIEANPDVQANARYNLAQIEVVRGATAHARELLEQAQTWWTGRPGAARAILNESRSTQAKIERAEGKVDLALATLHDAIAERRALIGHDDFEVGNLLNTLSNALTQAGLYEEAEARSNESYGVFQRLGQADTDGGMAALNSRGNAALMMGHNERALPDFRHVADMTRALYGETTKLAASLNNVGVALTRLGRYDEALPCLEEAMRIAIAQNGERSPLSVTVRVSLAELYARLGRVHEAEPLAEAAVAIAGTNYAANKTMVATAHRARASVRFAEGREAEARDDIEQATALFHAAGKAGEGYLRLMEPLRLRIGTQGADAPAPRPSDNAERKPSR
jgi:serine/threonine-protein kinase